MCSFSIRSKSWVMILLLFLSPYSVFYLFRFSVSSWFTFYMSLWIYTFLLGCSIYRYVFIYNSLLWTFIFVFSFRYNFIQWIIFLLSLVSLDNTCHFCLTYSSVNFFSLIFQVLVTIFSALTFVIFFCELWS